MNCMPSAIVLVNTNPESVDLLVSKLLEIDGITEAYRVYGVYDIIAKVEAKTLGKVKEIVSKRMRKINFVRSTITMMVATTR